MPLNPAAVAADPAFSVMLVDILGNVLKAADQPTDLGSYLTEEIRSLTGARCVLLVESTYCDLELVHRVISVNPARRMQWASDPTLSFLFVAANVHPAVHLVRASDSTPVADLLHQNGFDLSLVMPLCVGDERVGSLILLGLPDEEHIHSVVGLLKDLSTVVALILRNALLFDRQERVIALRTQELVRSVESLNRELIERERAESALSEREKRHRTILSTAMDGFWAVALSGQLLEVNQAYCRMSGYNEAELLAMSIGDLEAEEKPDDTANRIQRIRVQGEDRFESSHRRKDGSAFAVEISVQHRPESSDFLFVFVRDITERKRRELAHNKLQEQLVQAQKMEAIGRLAGGVAHDFNNMLCVILSHAEETLEVFGDNSVLSSHLEEIRNAATRSAELTRQLLAFARKQVVTPRALDLNDTVEDMLKMLRRLIGENIEITWKPGKNMGPVWMDPSQIDQILANLCVNARDAIGGSGKVCLETIAQHVADEIPCCDGPLSPGDYVSLTISDNGCGMDQATVSRIFEPFFTTKALGVGTGLGLATVYGIVKQNGGTIAVESTLTVGTTFTVYLPRHAGSLSSTLAPITVSHTGATELVLVVEDEPALLDVTSKLLSRKGYRTLCASNPHDALKLAKAHATELALLLTDVVLPQMDGRELAAQVRAFCPHLAVVFMSGYTTAQVLQLPAFPDGANFVQKPFTSNALLDKLHAALERKT